MRLGPHLKGLVRLGVLNDRSRSGIPTVINQEKVDEVNDFLQTHSGSNVRSVAEASSIPQTTTYRIRTELLLLKPYKAQFVQQLYEDDHVEVLLPLLTEPRNKDNISFCSDEAVFHLNDLVNKHHVRYWSEENLRVTIETLR